MAKRKSKTGSGSGGVGGASGLNMNIHSLEGRFRQFLRHVTIFSKDLGRTNIDLFDAQDYMLHELFNGLNEDIHWFVVGKSRQLGITTLCLLLDCFWCGEIPDVQGAVVFDTQQNKEKFRLLLQDMLDHLPKEWKLPTETFNRDFIAFRNGNILDFLTAGVKKGQGTLGRSRALNFAHCTELCSYGDPDAFEAFKDSLSDRFPARLYILESTARGYNLFNDEWEDAAEDSITKKTIFLGWWRKDTNRYDRREDRALFDRYGYEQKSKWEQEAEAQVRQLYNVTISLEQWAWFRHRLDPKASSDFRDDGDEQRAEIVHQEHPTTPEFMFRMTGSQFISGQMLKILTDEATRHAYKGYRYYIGEDITAVHLEQLPIAFRNQIQLRIWQEPVEGGRYVLAADPAYASGDESDFFCIAVCRVFADRCEQVAEFCERNMEHYQFAWVMAHLANYYANCRIIVDVNGPGEAVVGEFRHLRQMLNDGWFNRQQPSAASAGQFSVEEEVEIAQQNRHFRHFLDGVRDYMFHRFDSFGSGYNLQWKSSAQLQSSMMHQFRDKLMLGHLVTYSHECIAQMRRLVQDGMAVAAEGKSKKDRVIALAMANRCWIDMEQRELMANGRTFESEMAKPSLDGDEMNNVGQFVGAQMRESIERKGFDRERAARIVARPNWRTGVWANRRGGR